MRDLLSRHERPLRAVLYGCAGSASYWVTARFDPPGWVFRAVLGFTTLVVYLNGREDGHRIAAKRRIVHTLDDLAARRSRRLPPPPFDYGEEYR